MNNLKLSPLMPPSVKKTRKKTQKTVRSALSAFGAIADILRISGLIVTFKVQAP
jgi:hypothetical protein